MILFETASALASAGILVMASVGTVADHEHDAAFMECAKACDDCARICDACSAHCAKLIAEGNTDHLKTLATCADCAAICQTASTVMARQGPFSDAICTACQEACRRCGEACDAFKDDEMMQACAEECRRCEQACQEMLKHLAQHTE
jgi:hypothetical protein